MPNPEKAENPVVASFGVENASPIEQVLIVAGLKRAALKLLRVRLEDAIPSEERAKLDKALADNDTDGMVAIMRDRFPNYDELQQQAIEEARQRILAKAEAVKRDPGRLPEILEERIDDVS